MSKIEVTPEDRQKWGLGKAYFELLQVKYRASAVDLAAALAIPFPSRIVAVRGADDWWGLEYTLAIQLARSQYDAGSVEVITGRFGNHFFLYKFPRRERIDRIAYFNVRETE